MVWQFTRFLVEKAQGVRSSIRDRLRTFHKAVGSWIVINRAKSRLNINYHLIRLRNFIVKYIILISAIILTFSIIMSFILEYYFHIDIESILAKSNQIDSMLIGTGSALIGASAIAFSLIMFSLQINIERMPHGMFFRFSRDVRIVTYFIISIIFSIVICTLPIWIEFYGNISVSLLSAFWCIAGVFIAILMAYRRSLFLVNPVMQLNLVLLDVKKDFQRWSHFAEVAGPLIAQNNDNDEASSARSQFDSARMTYFQLNRHWTQRGLQAISHAISYAQRYSEHRDYSVAKTSLDVIVAINSIYIKAKGKTFFANSLIIDNPLVTDILINQTLEQLRQSFQVARARRDETAIEQIFQTFETLFYQYTKIDYSSNTQELTHANLATGYLSNAAESVITAESPDVLMGALRGLGNCAVHLVNIRHANSSVFILSKIMTIGMSGIVKKDHMPVSLAAVEQSARLTMALLCSSDRNLGFALRQTRSEIFAFARIVLQTPDAPMQMNHSNYLGSYFSSTKTEALKPALIAIVNQIAKGDVEKETAACLIGNIEDWADGLYEPSKELLLLAIKKRVHFTFDIVHWIVDVADILLALACNDDACPEYARDKLQRHATWMIATLSWIEKDEETITFLGNYEWEEKIFEAALAGRNRNCPEYEKQAFDLLLQWAYVGGRYQTGWDHLEQSLYGLTVLAIAADDGSRRDDVIRTNIVEWRDGDAPISEEIRARTARSIRERAQDLYRRGHWSRRIEVALSELPVETLQPFLTEIADLLSPETRGEEVRRFPI